MDYFALKVVHIVSATILFGTGIGTAFYMFMAALTRDAKLTAGVGRLVVIGDWLFTGSSGVVQIASGLWLAHIAGFPILSGWVLHALLLYGLAFLCWAPVVWIQIRLRDIAQTAADAGGPLPREYWRWLAVWVGLGIPAFFALVVVFWLMVAKPAGGVFG
ncbi:DUF2269 family protein [Derxia gummosa]|uniref:DUF2269 family protein n=1 Tax=Derxia gummosa DSM 723 TaxID=1121388 RepID=A0A8B6X5B6_9BURK|nr:DUF2269 domain-containing protein [Derxia gummosa]